jgi:aspartyl-tRNA(Asn)/glutamyl-tRNA(Gln) amidotransferase subunit C
MLQTRGNYHNLVRCLSPIDLGLGLDSMKITIADVEHVARLARLALTEEEKNLFAVQMDAIIGYVEKIKGLDTDGVIPTSHAVPMENAFREDTVRSSIGVEEALLNAPRRTGSFFKVPKVIE